jgi:hypothetical protein
MNQETVGKTKTPENDAAIKVEPAVDDKDASAFVPSSENGVQPEAPIVP